MFLDPSWPPLQCVKCCIASKSIPDSISQSCTHLSNEQTCFPMFALVRAHTSHHCMCAVASVCSIFINSYFYSEPCRFQSVLSEPRLQPKYHREEQWEDRQLWKGAATLCATRVKHCNYNPGRPQSFSYPCWSFDSQIPRPLSLIGSTLRFDKLDQAETRSLLMCFLHIMKTISDGKWNVFKSV